MCVSAYNIFITWRHAWKKYNAMQNKQPNGQRSLTCKQALIVVDTILYGAKLYFEELCFQMVKGS